MKLLFALWDMDTAGQPLDRPEGPCWTWTFLDWVRLGRQNGTAFLDYYDDIVDHTIMDATPLASDPGLIVDRHGHTIRLPPGPWRSASIAAIRETLEHAPKVLCGISWGPLPSCSDKWIAM